MNYKVKIKSPNKIFIIDNRPIRSPFECNVEQSKIHLILAKIKFYGLSEKDYTLVPNEIIIENKKEYSLIPSKKEIKKVNITTPAINTVNENIRAIKKNINKEEKTIYKKQIIQEKPKEDNIIKTTDKELLLLPLLKKEIKTEIVKDIEQNINYNSDEIEVTIEELTQKSSLILEKFLNDKEL